MCGVCGCDETHFHQHAVSHSHSHEHDHPAASETLSLPIEQQVLQYNQQFANANRDYFRDRGILAVNVMSSPGAGKTTLLAHTLSTLRASGSCFVIVADQQTHRDAERLSASGVPAWQINTGKGCHLDAHQLSHALESLALPMGTLLFIENVGNLVCPALFDLGETLKVVLLSVTEGDDKPLKYPHMFHAADLVVLTKIDLLPYVDFNIEQCLSYIQQINPHTPVLQLSVSTGQQLSDWYDFIKKRWV